MEDVLDVYQGAYDPQHPLVCMDECPKQLLQDVREPLPLAPEQPRREDFEYQREGTCNLFLALAPLQGWRDVSVTERRTKVDWAHYMRELVDVHFPEAKRITVVLDNLNTHTLASLYEAFEPGEARRIARKVELHYTPKHGSWLNMAEIELSALNRQCLKRRIPDRETMQRVTSLWSDRRNMAGTTVDWRFTTADARIKLKQLHPKI
jgi:transposase